MKIRYGAAGLVLTWKWTVWPGRTLASEVYASTVEPVASLE